MGSATLSWDYQHAASAFIAGCILYLIIHFFVHKPILTYVFGHEATHALFGLLFFAKISEFKVSKTGGSVKVSKSNFVITLAPYFFSLYTLILLLLWWIILLFWPPLVEYSWILYQLLGMTGAFHLAMTFESIAEGQSDIKSVGAFFALPFILALNLEFLVGGLHFLDVGVHFITYNQEVLHYALQYYHVLGSYLGFF